jgi:hypothetical protein
MKIRRPDPTEIAERLGGGEIAVMPDRRIAVVRRRWIAPLGEPRDPILELDLGPRERLILGIVSDTVGVVYDTARALAWIVSVVAQTVGHLLFGTRYMVEAVFDRGQPKRIVWRVQGATASRRAVTDIAAALRIGDVDYRSAERDT